MIIYLDLIFFMNFIYDFLILLTVGAILKRNIKIYRYLISSLVGALSLGLLFINISSYFLFIIKIIISIVLVIINFKYVSFRYTLNNLAYFYMVSIILAGFLYFLNLNFSLDHKGIIFFYNKFSINYLLLIIISPIILIYYIKSIKKIKTNYNSYYKIKIVFDNFEFNITSLFDNGNSLKDPFTGKPVIIVSKKIIEKIYNIRSPVYVPYKTINGSNIIECFKPSYIIVNNHKLYNYLIGTCDYKFSDGVEALLNVKLLEDNYV